MNFDKYVNECINTMQELIQIKTVQDVPVENGPFGKGNKECLEKMLSICEKMGFKVKNLDGYCGYAEVGNGNDIIGIIGHLDVVPEGEGWIYPPYSAKIVDDIMYGRGTWDDKGPVCMCLYALKALMDENIVFNKRVRFIFGCNEESGSRCVEHYIEKEGQITCGFSPDANFPVIFAEKTICNIKISGKATNNSGVKLLSLDSGIVINAVPDKCVFTLSYSCNNCKTKVISELEKYYNENNIKFDFIDKNNTLTYTIYGKAAHGSIPQCGINAASYAITGLSKAIDNSFTNMYAKHINTEHNGKSLNCYAFDEYGDIAVNVGIVKYDNDNFEILINSRLPFTTNSNKMANEIKETLTKYENVEVTLLSDSKGFKMEKDNKMVQLLMEAYQQVTKDYESKPLCIAGGTYAREFNNCVAYGPEMEGFGEVLMHQPNESIPLRAIKPIMEIYYNAIKNLVEKL